MNIPDKAVEAAARAAYNRANRTTWEEADDLARGVYLREAVRWLSPAAPFIAAQALRDEAERIEALDKDSGPERVRAYLRAKSLHLSANKLEFPQ